MSESFAELLEESLTKTQMSPGAMLMGTVVDIEERDRRDSERATAPLVMAENALYIDSSNMSIDAVIEEVLNLIH